jgi:phytoene dehydrogenase-like protein
MYDVIVIGGGPNGLVAATEIARKKLSTIVLETKRVMGGGAITTEFAPGFQAPTLTHALGPFRPDLIKSLKLEAAGLRLITPDPAITTLGRDGQTIVFHRDHVFTAESISRLSSRDAGRWRDFVDTTGRIASVLASMNRHAPPGIDDLTRNDRWRLFNTGRRARGLGPRNLARLMRWMPMSVADFVSEWFETDLLRAAVAARALFGNFAGPRSAGTGAMWLQRAAEDPFPTGSGATAAGGPGGFTRALALVAVQAGATLRGHAPVARILTKDGRVTGVALVTGEAIEARAVISTVDPRRTFLDLVDPEDLTPTFRQHATNIRARGVTAKLHLALSGLPIFPATTGDPLPMRGRFLIAPDLDYLERAFDAAKYGDFSPQPWLDIAIPSVLDPSLAPAGQHVMSIAIHFAPRHLRAASWSDAKDALCRAALDVLAPHAPGLEAQIIDAEMITPEDMETIWGLSGGHIFHGEPTLDQWWFARPLIDCARYATPITNLFLGGAGTHPGGGVTGASGHLAAKAVLQAIKTLR